MRIVATSDFDWAARAPDKNDVRIWAISLAKPPTEANELFGDLTLDEQTRADRYKVATARLQFVITRGLLRRLLGRQIGVAPREVPITYIGGGKPVLAVRDENLHFNVTHTDSLALIALAHRPVGIDIERVRPVTEPGNLVRRFFSAVERETFLALPSSLWPAGFFRGWTSKEAVIKAAGLSVAVLDEFDVELHPARPAALLAARHRALSAASWQLSAWEPAPGYCAAVATSESMESGYKTPA